jgi:hypothetical protein
MFRPTVHEDAQEKGADSQCESAPLDSSDQAGRLGATAAGEETGGAQTEEAEGGRLGD